MTILRRMAVFLLASGFSFFLLSTVYLTAVTTTVTPSNVKTWLDKNDIYKSLLDSALSTKNKVDLGTSELEQAIGQELVELAIRDTFTPAVLKDIGGQFIDGTNDWLTGKATKPTFSIDLKKLKVDYANSVGKVVEGAYLSLPACRGGQSVNLENPLASTCQDPRVDITPMLEFLKTGILEDKEFLPKETLNADNLYLNSEDEKQGKTAFEELSDVPKVYQFAQTAPYIFGVITIIIAILIFFATKTRRKGLKRIAVPLLSVGVFLVISVLMINAGVNKAETSIKANDATEEVVKNNITLPLLKEVKDSVNHAVLIFAVVYLVTSGGIITYLLVTRKPKQPRPEESTETKADGGSNKHPKVDVKPDGLKPAQTIDTIKK